MTRTVEVNIIDVKKRLHVTEWTAESLKKTRMKLGLKQTDIANVMDITQAAVSSIERGKTTNPWIIQMYGIVLEYYYAISQNYIPAFRKLGENEFMEEKDELRIIQ